MIEDIVKSCFLVISEDKIDLVYEVFIEGWKIFGEWFFESWVIRKLWDKVEE